MAQQNQVWSLGMDVSGAMSGLSQLIGGIKNHNAALQDATVTMVNYNAKLGQFQATAQGYTSTGDKVRLKSSFNPATGIAGLENFKISPDDRMSPLDHMSSTLSTLGSVAQFQLLKQAINAVSHAFVQGAQDAIKFQVTISEIRTISQDAGITFNQWSQGIQALSDKFGMNQVDVAAAAYEALSNQVVKGAEAFHFMDQALQFGQVTVATAKQSVDLLSSAIKSFELGVNQTDYIAATLFKTIELGRVKAEEMAGSFGRVASMSHVLGVSLEETEAAIATLTIQGMKYSDASVLLTNVLLKLAKPTGEMKKLMESWGTPTGEAAIATFGFAGVLRKVADAAHGSTGELAELFNEMRALKGAVGLTKFGGFEENLTEIKGAAESYKNAIKIMNESPGKQLEIQFTQIKNFFTNDLGQKGLAVLNEVTKSFGGLANIIKTVTQATLVATTVFISYTAVMKAAAAAQFLLGLASSTGARGLGFLGMSATGSAAAMAGLSTAIGAMAPVLAVAAAAWATYTLAAKNATQDALNQSDNIKRVQEKLGLNTTKFIDQSEMAQFREGIQNTFGRVGEIMAQNLVKAQERLRSLREDAAKFGEVLAINFKSLVDNINEGIREINRGINEARANIKESQKSLEGFKLSMEDSLFRFNFDIVTPEQQVNMLFARIRQLRDEAQKQFASGDKYEVENARRKYDEIARLAHEAYNKQIEFARKYMEENAGDSRVRMGFNPFGAVASLKATYEELFAERKKLEEGYQALQRKTIENFEELEAKEKARVNTIETAVKKFLELQKAITDGSIMTDEKFKDKFKDGQGLFDPEKARKALDEQAKLIIAFGGANAKSLVDFYDNLEKQKSNLFQVALAERHTVEIQEEQKQITKLKELQEQKAKAFSEAAAKATQEIPNFLKAIAGTLKDFDTALGIDNNGAGRGIKSFLRDFFGNDRSILDSTAAWKEANETIKQTFELLQQMQGPNAKFTSESAIKKMSNDVDEAQKKLEALARQQEEFLKKRLNDPNATLDNRFIKNPKEGEAGVTFKQLLDDSMEQLRLVREALDNVSKAKAEFDKIKDLPTQIIQNSTGALRDAFTQALTESDNATGGMVNGFADVGIEVNRAVDRVEALRKAIESLNATPINPIPSGVLGGVPKPRVEATGGYIGGPIGSDNIPAWLTKGEMVINAEATKMFRPMLEAMNQSRRPGYYNQGGYVTTNVGDININVTGSGDSQVDARRIGQELQRQIRRGTIRLR